MTSRVWIGVGLVVGLATAAAVAVAARGQCSRSARDAGEQAGDGWKPRGVRLSSDIEAIRRNTDRMLEIVETDHLAREAVPAG